MRVSKAYTISISAAATTYSASFAIPDTAQNISVFCNMTAVSGTSPTLDITPQFSLDDGTTWFGAEDSSANSLALAQITAVSQKQKHFAAMAPMIRFKFVAGGTSPVFTGTLTATVYGAQ